jgi:hypothetical protein
MSNLLEVKWTAYLETTLSEFRAEPAKVLKTLKK